jgi:hypothetical protein
MGIRTELGFEGLGTGRGATEGGADGAALSAGGGSLTNRIIDDVRVVNAFRTSVWKSANCAADVKAAGAGIPGEAASDCLDPLKGETG